MTVKTLLNLLISTTLSAGCSTGNPTQEKTKSQSNGIETRSSETGEKTHNHTEEKADENAHTDNVFHQYDAVKKILKNWNLAISDHRLQDLENLYADEVVYYSKNSSKQEIIIQKNEWLKKHSSYKQELKFQQVYYDDSDTLGLEFAASFTKICIENQKKTEVESFLYFRKFGNDWKIVRETDALTEINTAKRKPVINLDPGKYSYYTGRWSDTRDIPQFAHDQVPYNSSLDFTITANGITGLYNDYSGTMRSRTYYIIKSGKIVNGILELQAVFTDSYDPAPEDLDGSEPFETWRFKILENKQLLCLSKENLTLYSSVLRLQQ